MNNNKISVVKTENRPIEKGDIVTVYFSEKYMLISHKQSGGDVGYKKLSDNQYLNTATGEIKTVTKSSKEFRNVYSLRKTFFRLSVLISLNFVGNNSEVFISLTYDKKLTDEKTISRDIKNFWGRFCRFVDDYKLYKAIFISEYQQNFNKHLHILLGRNDNKRISLSDPDIYSLWGNGYVDVRPIYDVDGLINYLSPFHNKKKMERTSFYKPYEKIFRCRGQINRPQKLKMSYESALKLADDNNLVEYKNSSYEVSSDDMIVNIIAKKYFKSKKGTDNYERFQL